MPLTLKLSATASVVFSIAVTFMIWKENSNSHAFSNVFTRRKVYPLGCSFTDGAGPEIGREEPWGVATIDYSAANEYVDAHYPTYRFRPHATGTGDGHYFEDRENGRRLERQREPVYDARRGVFRSTTEEATKVSASLATCGFQLVNMTLSFSSVRNNFENNRRWVSRYLCDLRDDLLVGTWSWGGDVDSRDVADVIFWHATYREGGQQDGDDNDDEKDFSPHLPIGRVAPVVHIDTDVGAYRDNVEGLADLIVNNRVDTDPNVDTLTDEQWKRCIVQHIRSGKRFAILNFWKNVDLNGAPVRSSPLAILFNQGITSIGSDCIDHNYAFFPYVSPNMKQSRWYTFSEMCTTECLVFKQYDRDISYGPSDLWHCALPDVSPLRPVEGYNNNESKRKSFDVRALILFDQVVLSKNDRFQKSVKPTLTLEESECFCGEQKEQRKNM